MCKIAGIKSGSRGSNEVVHNDELKVEESGKLIGQSDCFSWERSLGN